MTERIFLIGFMGSGKSTVGRSLATMLGWRFVDTDRLVEESEGRSIDRIFSESGEGFFRESERRALEGLAEVDRVVVATGGGLFIGSAQRAFMKAHGVAVWLDVPFEEASARVGEGRARPLWSMDQPESLKELFESRKACYAKADHRVPVGQDSPDGIAEKIVKLTGGQV